MSEVIKKHEFVSCSECAKAIFVPKDIFTGKPRYFCGDNIWAIDKAYGDQTLMCDFYGGCEFGEEKVKCVVDDRTKSMEMPRLRS